MVVKISSVDDCGCGITRIHNKVCFVENALQDEVVEIEMVAEKKKYSIAKVSRYIEKSKDRVFSSCPYHKDCGGCRYMETSREYELKMKSQTVLEQLKRNIQNDFLFLGIESGNDKNYRNKVVLHSDGKRLGFYQEKTHNLVEIENCQLLDERINRIIPSLPKSSDIMIRTSNENDDLLIGEEDQTIISTIVDYSFRISHNSFFQVNCEITEKLYQYIYETVKSKSPKNVLDLYCGIGTIGIFIHTLVEEVLGVEIVEEAVEDANYNKKLNQIENISFLCGDVSKYIDSFIDQYDLIMVDPPRGGLAKKVVEEMIRISSKTIIYTSCNPRSLIRDLKLLSEKYEVESIKLFDMFPRTYHVETVCVLNRR